MYLFWSWHEKVCPSLFFCSRAYFNYSVLPLNSPTNMEQSTGKFAFEEKLTEDPSKHRGSVDFPEATRLLELEGGRRISSKAQNMPQDAYFSFLLLRHLRIRDLQHKVHQCNILKGFASGVKETEASRQKICCSQIMWPTKQETTVVLKESLYALFIL